MNLNAPDWLRMRASRSPDSPFLKYAGDTFTLGRVDGMVDTFRRRLEEEGVAQDDVPLGALSQSALVSCLLILAASRMDKPVCLLNPRLADQLLREQCAAVGLNRLYCAEWEGNRSSRRLEPAVCVSGLSIPQDTSIVEDSLTHATPALRGSLHSLQGYVFTSGTSGRPKAVTLTYGNHYWSALASCYRLGFATGDCWLHCMPLFHVGGLALLFRALLFGFSLQLMDGFDTELAKDYIQSGEVTMASLVPTTLTRLLDAGLDLRSGGLPFRFVLLGGARTDEVLRSRSKEQGVPIVPSYGMTETCSHIAAVGAPGSAGEGRAMPFAEIATANSAGEREPDGAFGEIWARGPQVAQTEACRDGWLPTKDVGHIDTDGILHVQGRSDDVFKIGGETIHVQQVTDVLQQVQGVKECWTTGVPDEEWGWRLIALIVPDAAGGLPEEDLRECCRQRLSPLHTPQRFLPVKQLPRNSGGKIRKDAARALALEMLA